MQLLPTDVIGLRHAGPVSSMNMTTGRVSQQKQGRMDRTKDEVGRAMQKWGVSHPCTLARPGAELVGLINDDRCMGGLLIWWGSNPPLVKLD